MARATKLAMVLLSVALLFESGAALAWGQDGHRVTARIAEGLLKPETRVRLNELDPGLDLVAISTQMDEERLALKKSNPGSERWHYNNKPICGEELGKGCRDGNCATNQIERWQKVLADKSASRSERLFALKVLVHVVGDIHQPLHAADHDDRGGNDVAVGRTNLHSLWDTGLVKKAMRGFNESKYALVLNHKFQNQILSYQSGNQEAWASESHNIAAKLAYGQLPGFSCSSQQPQIERLTPEYEDKSIGVIEEQLVKAGARLAFVLDRSMAK